MSESERKEETALEKLPELEILCPICEGEGKVRSEYVWRRCASCDGAGYTPTEFGAKVLELMRHNFRPMHDDLEDSRIIS